MPVVCVWGKMWWAWMRLCAPRLSPPLTTHTHHSPRKKQALRAVQADCRRMDSGTKSRLALAWANCHVASLGKKPQPCPDGHSLQQCSAGWDESFYQTHLQFTAKVDTCVVSVCACWGEGCVAYRKWP